MPMPLYVDLDGTLIHGDTMRMAFFKLLRRRPATALRSLWLLATRSRMASKGLIARRIELDPATFAYNAAVLDYVRAAKAQGRRVVLASGTWQRYVDAVVQNFPGLFDGGYGSDESINLIALSKLERIRRDAAGQPFEYLGDSHADVPIFHAAAVAGWVGTKRLAIIPSAATRLHRF